ncbi:fasciclin domain-containing protein [Arcticibacter eurypsychrophilus]|uniref:fasciclin domain-containing protein n=1 Tax=Arcticibacter eurypsychrophilus TaxID=1434752 RepID=UPI0009F218E8|nr:fasciclin domain-containing protein [Arcticibacter eurypsychrophilus]
MKNLIITAAVVAITGFTAINAQTTSPAETQDTTSTSTGQATTPTQGQDSTATGQNTGTTSTGTASPAGDVVQAISTSGYNASLTTAIKTAGLDQTLKGAGPFTIFAPSDQAFIAVPAGDSLLTQQAKLAKVLKHHVVVGQYTKDDIIKALTVGKGSTTLKTIDGDVLTLKVNESKNLELSDAFGNKALVTVFDIKGTNGTAHVINSVLVPKQ